MGKVKSLPRMKWMINTISATSSICGKKLIFSENGLKDENKQTEIEQKLLVSTSYQFGQLWQVIGISNFTKELNKEWKWVSCDGEKRCAWLASSSYSNDCSLKHKASADKL